MKTRVKQIVKKTTPDPRLIRKINRDRIFFQTLTFAFNIILVLGVVFYCFRFLK